MYTSMNNFVEHQVNITNGHQQVENMGTCHPNSESGEHVHPHFFQNTYEITAVGKVLIP